MYGDIESRKSDTDLLQAIIVSLGDADHPVDNPESWRLMNVLLSSKKDIQTKQKIMQGRVPHRHDNGIGKRGV